mmetsp:Transcript_895/g.1938  ORF Transcript_895/g.1938 Transcript_895/m.1938 type:complete len:105 (-) Transcript_895:3860-4174(-)
MPRRETARHGLDLAIWNHTAARDVRLRARIDLVLGGQVPNLVRDGIGVEAVPREGHVLAVTRDRRHASCKETCTVVGQPQRVDGHATEGIPHREADLLLSRVKA